MGKMKRPEDYIGKTINYLYILDVVKALRSKQKSFRCLCICGNEKVILCGNVLGKNKPVKSCGCMRKAGISESNSAKLEGEVFGRLTVIKKVDRVNKGRSIYWLCSCSCGGFTEVSSGNLISGAVKSCGCARHEANHRRFLVHGLCGTPEYILHKSNKRRELSIIHDTEWDLDMSFAIKDLFKSCVICGSTENLAIDRVLPLSKGYGLKPGNAVILCQHHNAVKRDKDLKDLPLEWQANIIWNAIQFKNYWEELQENKPEELPEPIHTQEEFEADMKYWDNI